MNISSLKKKKKLMVLKHIMMFPIFYLINISNINTAVIVFVQIMEIKRNVNFVCDC